MMQKRRNFGAGNMKRGGNRKYDEKCPGGLLQCSQGIEMTNFELNNHINNHMKKLISFIILCGMFTAPLITNAQSTPGLFDGKTLKGWHRVAGTADYKVED